MREMDELRRLSAGRILTLWRESGTVAEEPLERALLCNAAVLAESCLLQGEPVFENMETVLQELTPCEMEVLLGTLSRGEVPAGGAENPSFDPVRFDALRRA